MRMFLEDIAICCYITGMAILGGALIIIMTVGPIAIVCFSAYEALRLFK